MRRKMLLLLVLAFLFGWADAAQAQLWSGILDPSRATDWTQAGVTGGIPNRTTICATLSPGATAAQINSAISACPANQVVFLNAGTYNLSAGIGFAGKNNVTLRGMGPDKTILKFSGGNGCSGDIGGLGDGLICVQGSAGGWAGFTKVTNLVNWTGNYAQGTTQLQLSSTTGLIAGTVVVMDQCDETTDDGGITNSAYGTYFLNESQTRGRVDATCSPTGVPRSLQEYHKIVSVDSGTLVTITPPVIMPTWRSGQSPQLWWWGTSSNTYIQGAGVEALTVNGQATSTTGDISFCNAYDSWVDNVRVIGFNRGGVSFRQAAHITVRNSYFYLSNHFQAEAYGADILSAGNLLIINNIYQHMVTSHMGPAPGSVFAYNYTIDTSYSGPGDNTNFIGIFGTHDAGGGEELYEGNQSNGLISDFPHGQTPLLTMFRNHFRGSDERSGCCPGGNRLVFVFEAFSRGYSAVGNVLGLSGTTRNYECNVGGGVCPGGQGDLTIYQLGESRGGSTPNDPLVKTTLLRWGNFDTVTGTSRFVSAEVPTIGIPRLNGNPVPAFQVLPASFFLASKPSWWGTPFGNPAWPPIGPDVTGGNHPDPNLGGRVWQIPARLCYYNAPIDTANYPGGFDRGVLLFNANACYTNTPSVTPPQNLRVQ